MTRAPISQHGIKAALPTGWDGIIYRRLPGPGETTHAVMHTASFPLPMARGDYGSGAVERMSSTDVLVALVESSPASAMSPLYSAKTKPQNLTVADFSPNTLQHPIPGQAGAQRFFAENGRAFCLYVVLGSLLRAPSLLPLVNQVLQGLELSGASS